MRASLCAMAKPNRLTSVLTPLLIFSVSVAAAGRAATPEAADLPDTGRHLEVPADIDPERQMRINPAASRPRLWRIFDRNHFTG